MFNIGQRAASGRVSVVLSALLLASGCSVVGGSSTELRPVATNPYGLGQVDDGEETLLVGTAPWCVSKGPVRLTGLAWEDGGDVDIADFAVVNQPASANRIGSDRGELSAVGLSGADREVTTPCTAEPEDGPEMISYLVLALRTTDPTHITYGKRLVARWKDEDGRTGQAVDDFSIVLCPRGSPTCDDDNIVDD